MKRLLIITLSIIAVSLGFNTGSVFADEPADVVYTYNSSTNPGVICGGNTGVTCSDYAYLMIDSNFIQTDFSNPGVSINLALYASFPSVTTQYNQGIGLSRHIVFSLPDISKLESWWVGSTNVFPQDWEVKLTLTNDFKNCPICPEPQDPNRSPIMDDFHNVFINTMLSVIPITAIIFVVWFFIDMLSSLVFGRGK